MKKFIAIVDNKEVEFNFEKISESSAKIILDGQEFEFDISSAGSQTYSLLQNGKSFRIGVNSHSGNVQALYQGEALALKLIDEKKLRRSGGAGGAAGQASGDVTSPMPGRVVKIHVTKGQAVKTGDGVAVVEAMKMENEFKAPKDGTVKDVKVKVGDSVESGAILVVIE